MRIAAIVLAAAMTVGATLGAAAQDKPIELKPEISGRDKAGGFDPYNQRGSGKRQGEAAQRAGVTGSPTRERGSVLDQLTGKKK